MPDCVKCGKPNGNPKGDLCRPCIDAYMDEFIAAIEKAGMDPDGSVEQLVDHPVTITNTLAGKPARHEPQRGKAS